MLIDQLKEANLEARKEKNNVLRDIYTIIINKYMQAEIDLRVMNKTMSDDDLIRIIQKSIKELEEEAANYEKVNNHVEAEHIKVQIEALSAYLPKMLTKEEVLEILKGLPDKSIQGVMKHFKLEYGNRVDMKMVSDGLKEI